MEFLTRMFPELLRVLFLLSQSFVPRTCGLKNSSSLPFLSNLSSSSSTCLHLEEREKWLSDGDWRSAVSVSHRFIVPACFCSEFCHLRHYKVSFWGVVPLFWDRVLRLLGVSGQQLDDVAWQDSPFLTDLTSLPHDGLNWAVLLPETLFSLWLMAQGY